MEDLGSSTFFDQRTIDFISKLLNSSLRADPITGVETKLMKHTKELRQIDEELSGGLIACLNNCKAFVATPDAVQFLLEAHKQGKLEDARESLYMMVRDTRKFSLKQLYELLDESEKMPMIWAISLIGDDDYSRYEPQQQSSLPPLLDLDRLRDFK